MANYHGKSIGPHRYDLVRKMIEDGKTAHQIGEALGVVAETVRKFARKRGLKIERQDMSLEKHPSWRGGVTFDRSGYKLIRLPVDGPYGYLIRAIQKRGKDGTDNHGYAPEHRIAMHEKLGRKLRKGEVVDHIDFDKTNNHPDNLRVFSSNAEHLKKTLVGRVPNWTPEGYARMCGPRSSRQLAKSEPAPTESHPKSGDQA